MRQPVLPLLLDREHLHRDVARRRIELEVVEHGPAQHVRQEDVERDRRRQVLLGQRDRRLPAVGHDALEALVARQAEQDAGVVRIVVDDEQHVVALADVVAIVGDDLLRLRDGEHGHGEHGSAAGIVDGRRGHGTRTGRTRVGDRQVERERAALAGRADQPDLAAEQRRQLAADREAEAGAAVLAAGAGVGLLERLEDQPLLLGRDADAGVGDLDRDRALHEPQNRMIRRPSGDHRLHPHRHLALRGELEGVRQQVLQNLLQALGVAGERARQRVVDVDVEREVLGLRHVVERALDAVAQRREGDLLGFDGDGARLDLRQVENVVDQREQVGAGRVDVLGEVHLLGRQVAAACFRRAAGRGSESS